MRLGRRNDIATAGAFSLSRAISPWRDCSSMRPNRQADAVGRGRGEGALPVNTSSGWYNRMLKKPETVAPSFDRFKDEALLIPMGASAREVVAFQDKLAADIFNTMCGVHLIYGVQFGQNLRRRQIHLLPVNKSEEEALGRRGLI